MVTCPSTTNPARRRVTSASIFAPNDTIASSLRHAALRRFSRRVSSQTEISRLIDYRALQQRREEKKSLKVVCSLFQLLPRDFLSRTDFPRSDFPTVCRSRDLGLFHFQPEILWFFQYGRLL